jgi:endonuclease G
MFNYACSVDDVEKLTGHDFFYNLPDEIENVVEASWRMKDWQ